MIQPPLFELTPAVAPTESKPPPACCKRCGMSLKHINHDPITCLQRENDQLRARIENLEGDGR